MRARLHAAARSAWRVAADRRLRWLRRGLLAFGCVGFVLAAAWTIAVHAADFPVDLLNKDSATSLVVTDDNGVLLRQEASSADLRSRWVPLATISPHLVAATLASEDSEFYEHDGVDWSALGRATWLNLRGLGIEYGGSTITMQLVRLTAHTERTWRGKLRQLVLAARLERSLSKHEILEQYLNRVYYGNGAWGIEQASRMYFHKSASQLSIAEAGFLAVLPRGPAFYDPYEHRERLLRRRSHIFALMSRHGDLDAFERALAERVPLQVSDSRPPFRAPHFVELVKDRLPVGLRDGASVRTTLDWALQRQLEVALANHLGHVGSRGITQAALVVLRNSDGAILGLVGSKDYADRIRNGAWNGVTARLRPGSTLKPFVYGTALERGDTAATIADDVILPSDAHQFYTKDVRSHGFARYREALAGSYNLSAVHVLQRVGVGPVLRKLRAAGVATLDQPDASYDWGLAIGHAEVRLLDLTAAFTLFGRGGRPVEPRAIEVATTANGRTWSEPVRVRERVFSEEVAYIVFDMLSDPDARKPMFGDRVPLNLPFPIALKTGTTKAYTDLWAIGVTREYTVGVWAGNFDGAPTHQVMSTEGATPLLRAAYTAIAGRLGTPTAPPRPQAVVAANVCPLSGKLPGRHCEHHKRELFIGAHLPSETCDWHQLVCGRPAIVYPKALRGWARHHERTTTAACEIVDASVPPRITYPIDGARFILEPHRSVMSQRPPLTATPATADLRWTIDGVPADTWIPTAGTHRVVVTRGAGTRDELRDLVTIVYE